jgi:hypothetical protein
VGVPFERDCRNCGARSEEEPVDNKSTQSGSSGSAADAGAAIATISTAHPESEAKLRALVAERGPALRIRLDAPADFDVTGHALDAASLTLHVVDEDDTEGHAISLHFPRVEEAKHFQQRMIATGAIVGTMVIVGSGLALSQALPDAGVTLPTQAQAQVESITGGRAAADVTYGSEALTSGAGDSASSGAALTGKEAALMAQIGGADAVATSGGQAAADPTYGAGASASTGAVTSGGQAAADPTYGAGASASTGAVTSGGQAAADPTYGAGDSESSGAALTGKEEALMTQIGDDEEK